MFKDKDNHPSPFDGTFIADIKAPSPWSYLSTEPQSGNPHQRKCCHSNCLPNLLLNQLDTIVLQEFGVFHSTWTKTDEHYFSHFAFESEFGGILDLNQASFHSINPGVKVTGIWGNTRIINPFYTVLDPKHKYIS